MYFPKKKKLTKICSSRKNSYPTHGRSLEIPSRRGVLKANVLGAMYENKLEFPGGRGEKQKPFVGGVWIFSGMAQCTLQVKMLHDKNKSI